MGSEARSDLLLSRVEAAVLRRLDQEPGEAVSRDDLIAAWPGGRGSRDRLTTAIKNLRRRIGSANIRTVRGVGYLLRAEWRSSIGTSLRSSSEIALQLTAEIRSGMISGRLPTLRQLQERFDVSEGRAYRAVKLLAAWGYIELRGRGRRPIVVSRDGSDCDGADDRRPTAPSS